MTAIKSISFVVGLIITASIGLWAMDLYWVIIGILIGILSWRKG